MFLANLAYFVKFLYGKQTKSQHVCLNGRCYYSRAQTNIDHRLGIKLRRTALSATTAVAASCTILNPHSIGTATSEPGGEGEKLSPPPFETLTMGIDGPLPVYGKSVLAQDCQTLKRQYLQNRFERVRVQQSPLINIFGFVGLLWIFVPIHSINRILKIKFIN